jgi:hypothetical protein
MQNLSIPAFAGNNGSSAWVAQNTGGDMVQGDMVQGDMAQGDMAQGDMA